MTNKVISHIGQTFSTLGKPISTPNYKIFLSTFHVRKLYCMFVNPYVATYICCYIIIFLCIMFYLQVSSKVHKTLVACIEFLQKVQIPMSFYARDRYQTIRSAVPLMFRSTVAKDLQRSLLQSLLFRSTDGLTRQGPRTSFRFQSLRCLALSRRDLAGQFD